MRNRYWCLTAPRQLSLLENSLESVNGVEVRIGFHFCGLCGSDISKYEGRRPDTFPISMGHEFVATVEEIGEAVTTLAPGDVVVSDLNYRCGECSSCNQGQSHLCHAGQKGEFTNRGFADRAIIDESYLVKVDIPVPIPSLAYAEPLSCVLHAYAHTRLNPGDYLLVLGAGSLGTCMAMALLNEQQPAAFYDENQSRLLNLTDCSTLFSIWDKHAVPDVVLDLTGSLNGLETAVSRVRRGGRVVSMSHLDGHGSSEFLLPTLTRKDVCFTMSYLNGERTSLSRAIDIILETPKHLVKQWTNVKPVSEIESVFQNRHSSSANKAILDTRMQIG